MASWFQANAASYFEENLKDKAGFENAEAVIAEFGVTGSHLAIALKKFDGGLQFLDSFVGLSVAEIQKLGQEHGLKEKKIVPFAKDIDGNLQCVRVSDGVESVVAWDCDEKEVTEDLKLSFGQYLEDIRDKLLLKKLEYEDGMGLF